MTALEAGMVINPQLLCIFSGIFLYFAPCLGIFFFILCLVTAKVCYCAKV